MKGEGAGPADVTMRDGGTVYEFFRMVRNVKPLLGRINQHTLIFHPREDDQSDLKNTMLLQRKLAGMVDVCVLEDSYHLVTLDRQRGVVADRTAEFADRISSRIASQVAANKPAARSSPDSGPRSGMSCRWAALTRGPTTSMAAPCRPWQFLRQSWRRSDTHIRSR